MTRRQNVLSRDPTPVDEREVRAPEDTFSLSERSTASADRASRHSFCTDKCRQQEHC
jgi:hypothetical protein